MRKKRKETLLNIASNLFLQLVTILSGFIIPRLIISTFGSETNGLISSITQFLNYITLLEGGITGVVMTSLYKPIVNKNKEKINQIYCTAQGFFKRISFIFILYTLILSIAYPLLFNTHFSFLYIFTLTWILSVGLLIQYMFSLSIKILLNADKKIYVTSLTQAFIIILNLLATIIVVKVFPNIHLLKIISGALFIIQPIIFEYYSRRHYKLKKTQKDVRLIAKRWDGFAVNLAYFIHFSTDITILTIFTDLKTVSIYSVYSLVTNGMRQIIQSITNSINPVIGQAYATGKDEVINKKLDTYEYIVSMTVCIFFSVVILLITPFVVIYTSGVSDADYNQPLFGVLLAISEAVYLLRMPHLHLAYAANKYREITPAAFIEAAINIIISVLLVNKIGLTGVAIGTLAAMIYRLIYHINLTTVLLKNRSKRKTYYRLSLFILTSLIGILLCYLHLNMNCSIDIINLIIYSIIYVIFLSILFLIMSRLFFKKEIEEIKKYIK